MNRDTKNLPTKGLSLLEAYFSAKALSAVFFPSLLAATFYTPHPQQNSSVFTTQAAFSPLFASISEDSSFLFQPGPDKFLTSVQPDVETATVWMSILAQSTPAIPPVIQDGNQIIINGRTIAAPWRQQQQRIAVADVALVQSTGLELLNTENPTKQPVQWFSQPNIDPLVLDAQVVGQYRYLDITDLAQRLGWQTQVVGRTLQITTPASRVLAVRQGRQVWGDRIVVDLDRSTLWQVVEQSGELIVTVNAQADPALIQNFQTGPGNRLTALKVEASGNQTVIRVAAPNTARKRTWSLPNPSRLVIDVGSPVVPRNIVWAPGIRWQEQVVTLGNAQFPVIAFVVNTRQPGLTIKPILSNPSGAPGTAPLISIAQGRQAIAAINGGFFNRNNQLPLGAIRQDNRWISGPILNRGAIAWNEAGEVTMGRLALQETLIGPSNQRFPVLTLNSGYVQAGIGRYTSDWGTTYTPILDNEIIVTVQNNRVSSQQPGGSAGQTAFPIPRDGYLLAVRAYQTAANAIPPGTEVQIETATLPADFGRFPQILGAGPLLVQNWQIVLNAQAEQFTDAFIRQAAVRSAIGTTADGNLLIITIQNRVGGLGPTLTETAQIMQQLGAVNALNLDGGSSTSLYLGGQLLNRAPSTAARVHNGIGIFLQPN